MAIFTRFIRIEAPAVLDCGEARKSPSFEITFTADCEIPFPQVVLHGQGQQKLINGAQIRHAAEADAEYSYVA